MVEAGIHMVICSTTDQEVTIGCRINNKTTAVNTLRRDCRVCFSVSIVQSRRKFVKIQASDSQRVKRAQSNARRYGEENFRKEYCEQMGVADNLFGRISVLIR